MIIVEVWKSDQNREERHLFIKGGGTGYQPNTYLFGYNPQIIDEDTAKRLEDFIRAYTEVKGYK